jgi:hypothetical protein
LRYPHIVQVVADWLLYLHSPDQMSGFVLDAIATLLHMIPVEELQKNPEWSDQTYWGPRNNIGNFLTEWIQLARRCQSFLPEIGVKPLA